MPNAFTNRNYRSLKKHFGSAMRLNNRASRIFEASVEALGLDRASLISGPVIFDSSVVMIKHLLLMGY